MSDEWLDEDDERAPRARTSWGRFAVMAAVVLAAGALMRLRTSTAVAMTEYHDAAGGYSVMFPCRYVWQSRLTPTEMGELAFVCVESHTRNAYYVCGYVDYLAEGVAPDKTAAMLDRVRDSILKNTDSRLLRESDVEISGHRGRAIEMRSGDRALVLGRLLVVDRRLYQVTVVMRNDDQRKQAVRVLESFRLDDRVQP